MAGPETRHAETTGAVGTVADSARGPAVGITSGSLPLASFAGFVHTGYVAWLVTGDARVLASAEVASDRAARRKGLLGRTGTSGGFVIPRCRWVHTVGMKFPIDVAFVDHEGRIVKTAKMKPHRVGLPVKQACYVIEAEAGSFARWPLEVGDVIRVRDAEIESGLPAT